MKHSTIVANYLLEIGAVRFGFDPPFTYTSGLKSPIYLDNRKVMSYPKIRSHLIEMYLQEIEKQIQTPITCISATATAAIPMGAWLSDHLKVPMVYVRMKSKQHGLRNQIEGDLVDTKNVLVIEDHLSSAKSLRENVDVIRHHGGCVTTGMVTTTYESPASYENLEAMDINLICLATGRDIVDIAFQNSLLTFDQKESICQWFKDPVGWASNFFKLS